MASLSSVVNSRSGDTDLTALAATDWYALDTGATVCRKSGGGSLITLNISGSGGTNSGANGTNTITFSDGTPTASVSASAFGWYDYGTTTIVVPASTTTDTCYVYVDDSNNAAGVNWSAHLSDSSVGDISGTYTLGVHTHVFTFAAGSAGQTLTITISNGNNYNTFAAVALAQGAAAAGHPAIRRLGRINRPVSIGVDGVRIH